MPLATKSAFDTNSEDIFVQGWGSLHDRLQPLSMPVRSSALFACKSLDFGAQLGSIEGDILSRQELTVNL